MKFPERFVAAANVNACQLAASGCTCKILESRKGKWANDGQDTLLVETNPKCIVHSGGQP